MTGWRRTRHRWPGRCLRAALVLALGVPSALVVTAPDALACSCVGSELTAQVARSDAVFTGRAIGRAPEPGREEVGSNDPVTWAFGVDQVGKGAPREPQAVVSARHEASCGFEFEVGRTYLVLGRNEVDGSLSTGLCDGTQELLAVSPAELDALGLRAVPPTTIASPAPPTPPPAAEPGPPPALLLAVVGVLLGGGVLGAAVARRRRRP